MLILSLLHVQGLGRCLGLAVTLYTSVNNKYMRNNDATISVAASNFAPPEGRSCRFDVPLVLTVRTAPQHISSPLYSEK